MVLYTLNYVVSAIEDTAKLSLKGLKKKPEPLKPFQVETVILF